MCAVREIKNELIKQLIYRSNKATYIAIENGLF